MDRHMCIYTLKASSSHTRCVFTGDLGMFTNGYENQMEHRVYDPYYRLSEEGVQPVLPIARQGTTPILRHMHLRLKNMLNQEMCPGLQGSRQKKTQIPCCQI